MFINKKYLIRHKLLGALQKRLSRFDGKEHVNVLQVESSVQELSNELKLPEKVLMPQIDYLNENKEITANWRESVLKILIISKGSISYFDKTYLKEGKKEFRDIVYDKLKIISTIVLLIIAVSGFVINIIETRHNKREIEKLKSQLQEFKNTTEQKK